MFCLSLNTVFDFFFFPRDFMNVSKVDIIIIPYLQFMLHMFQAWIISNMKTTSDYKQAILACVCRTICFLDKKKDAVRKLALSTLCLEKMKLILLISSLTMQPQYYRK